MRADNFVLDVNVLLRFFVKNRQDFLIDIITYFPKTKFYYCAELLEEFERILTYEELKDFELKTKSISKFIKTVFTEHKLKKPIKKRIPEDPKDDYLIALALETNSACLVTEDDKAFHNNKERLYKFYPHLKFLYKKDFEKLFYDKIKKKLN
ncbi:MAG: putative toxin-antitoxin system toxin component, PIN family [Bacteroidetes bacterium]|nr:putative toxin-antitoxin system toxin component, PIN family [Bacteroidota bacterium]